MIRAIFFDSAGVLMTEGYTLGIKAYEKKHSIQEGKLYSAMHDFLYWKDFTLGLISEDDYFQLVRKKFHPDLNVTELKNNILENFFQNTDLINYIRSLKNKYIIGVISNNPKEWFNYFIQTFKWEDLFNVKAVSGYIHIRKPAVEIFQYALNEAKVLGEEAVYVDDRPDRIEDARLTGMHIVVFKNLTDFKKQLNKIFKNN